MIDETRRVFGIDLGTTYSCVAQVDEHDKAVVLKNFEGKDITPSAVYFSGENEVLVGEPAKENSKLEPDKTVTFIKRQMSRDDAFEKPTKFPNGLTPTEISAYILRKIVQDANDSGQYAEPIKKVVITCPAYFGEKERLRTRQAGEIAGLEVLAIINEPTAAAIAYGQEKREGEKNVLVYDLGGGTFDVTLIKVSGGNITVIATDGNSGLGGYDWDRELAKYLLSEYNRKKGTSYELKEGTALFNEMMLLAEEQKKRLSVKNRDKNSPVTALATIKGETAKIDITRAAFDAMTSMLLDETIEKTHEVLGIGKEKGFTRLDEVLLVGGSCRMFQIEERINKEFNCKSKINDPDCCVAKGAAILALNKSFTIESEKYDTGESDIKPRGLTANTRINATNVTSKNYGLGITDRNTGRDLVQNLIPANTPLNGNCRGEDTFAVPKDGLAFLNFPIYESDNRTKELYDVEMATLLEQHSLALPEGIKQDDPAKVVFEIDTEGFLHVHGDVLGSIIEFEIKLKGVMNEQELKEAKLRVGKAKVE